MASVREEIQKRIERKRSDINGFETQIREAHIYIQALEDTLKLLPRGESVTEDLHQAALRPGSAVAQARDIIEKAGKPIHVMDILKIMGKNLNKMNRAAMSGSMSAYARRGEIFTRPAPNTFGLIGFPTGNYVSAPPEDFGLDTGGPAPEQPSESS